MSSMLTVEVTKDKFLVMALLNLRIKIVNVCGLTTYVKVEFIIRHHQVQDTRLSQSFVSW